MSKQRMINTKFWDDNYIIDLDPVEKLLFLYFLTSPLTNISGIYEVPLRRIAFDTGIDSEMVKKILDRFENDNKMIYRDGWLAIKNFIQHQAVNPKVVAGIRYELEKVPEILIDYINFDYKEFKFKPSRPKISKTKREKIFKRDNYKCKKCGSVKNIEIDHIKPIIAGGDNSDNNLQVLCQPCNGKKNAELRWKKNGSVIYSPPIKMGRLSHTNINTNINSKSKKSINYTSDFEKFWTNYPNKVGKGKAFESWQKRKKPIPKLEDLIVVLKKQNESNQWQEEGGRYIPHPTTWLNQRRWEDDLKSFEKKEGDHKCKGCGQWLDKGMTCGLCPGF